MAGYYLYNLKSSKKIVTDPGSGQRVIQNELTVLTSGQDVVSLIKPYGGTVVLEIKKTNTYQVRFPVKDLSELDVIKTELNKKGVTATYSMVIERFE